MPMAHEFGLTLNPRVSILRYGTGVYLFDPVTRIYASTTEPVLALLRNLNEAETFNGWRENGYMKLPEVIEQLKNLEILVAPDDVNKKKTCSAPAGFASISRLHLFVTTKCNLRCNYCYAEGGDSKRTIRRDIWRLAMDHFFSNVKSGATHRTAKSAGVNLTLHGGGEPTAEFAVLQEIVAEFRQRASAAGLPPSVVMGTNGTYREAVHKWIVENDISVSISLDGPSDVQNRQRPFRSGRPSYGVVVRNLLALVEEGMRVAVRATITDKSIDSMEATVELAKQLGLAQVSFEPVTLTGRGAFGDLSRPDPMRFVENFLKCFLLGLKHDIDVRCSLLHCFGHYRQQFCSACGNNFCVTPDGNITTCYEVLDQSDLAADTFFIGKVDPVKRRIVLSQSRIDNLKKRIADNMEACAGCFLRYHCAGDCPIKSFRYSDNIYYPDPYRCQIARQINTTLIAWLADGVIEPRDVERARTINASFA
jgi:uncharacterized protein